MLLQLGTSILKAAQGIVAQFQQQQRAQLSAISLEENIKQAEKNFRLKEQEFEIRERQLQINEQEQRRRAAFAPLQEEKIRAETEALGAQAAAARAKLQAGPDFKPPTTAELKRIDDARERAIQGIQDSRAQIIIRNLAEANPTQLGVYGTFNRKKLTDIATKIRDKQLNPIQLKDLIGEQLFNKILDKQRQDARQAGRPLPTVINLQTELQNINQILTAIQDDEKFTPITEDQILAQAQQDPNLRLFVETPAQQAAFLVEERLGFVDADEFYGKPAQEDPNFTTLRALEIRHLDVNAAVTAMLPHLPPNTDPNFVSKFQTWLNFARKSIPSTDPQVFEDFKVKVATELAKRRGIQQ